MLSCDSFYGKMAALGVDFYTGVPDSLLKDICAYITDHCRNHVIAANEGGAIALASGYHLATGKIPLVYMQNSGLGNTVNPLTSLADPKVYSIPMILMIGWRGEPGVHDEPQHVKQGAVTAELLNVLGTKSWVLAKEEAAAEKQLAEAFAYAREHQTPVALLIQKDSFQPYKLKPAGGAELSLSRENAIQLCAQAVETVTDAVIVSTTGMISRELFSFRKTRGRPGPDFYNVGSMGHASQIALGVCLAEPTRPVFCFDGDGAVLMHMGSLAIIAQQRPRHFKHVVFNNGAHDSVGGQPTVGFEIDLCGVAKATGYKHVFRATSEGELKEAMQKLNASEGPAFLEVRVAQGARKDLPRPDTTPLQNKQSFMKALRRER